MPKPTRSERVVFLGDTHFGCEDPDAIRLALEVTQQTKPDYVYLIGDILDTNELKKYDKNPDDPGFDVEIEKGNAFLDDLQARTKSPKMVWLDGNHEERLNAFKWKLPKFARTMLTIPFVMGLKKRKIRYCPYLNGKGGVMHRKGMFVEHGDRHCKHSSYTAKNMFEDRKVSGISGHTHRLGSFYCTSLAGNQEWYENGCLRNLSPSWLPGTPNWQQGFHVAHFLGNDFFMSRVQIKSGKLMYDGSLL